MNIFLVSLLIIGLSIILGIVFHQNMYIKRSHIKLDNTSNKKENPLLLENIYKIESSTHTILKEELQHVVMNLIKLLISVKKKIRLWLDKSIQKLAKIAFPEETWNGPLDENTMLLHIEKEKQVDQKGRIE